MNARESWISSSSEILGGAMMLRARRCGAHLSHRQDAISACGVRTHRFLSLRAGDPAAVQSSHDKGLAFEARVVQVLRRVGCELEPTQMSRDGGIDHIGRWRLPDAELDVVTQCKNERKPVSVQHVREFFGVLGMRASPTTLAIFLSSSGYSIYAQRFFARSMHAAILCTIADDDRIVEFLLNDRARAALPRLAVGSCFVDQEHQLMLTYGDQVLGA